MRRRGTAGKQRCCRRLFTRTKPIAATAHPCSLRPRTPTSHRAPLGRGPCRRRTRAQRYRRPPAARQPSTAAGAGTGAGREAAAAAAAAQFRPLPRPPTTIAAPLRSTAHHLIHQLLHRVDVHNVWRRLDLPPLLSSWSLEDGAHSCPPVSAEARRWEVSGER